MEKILVLGTGDAITLNCFNTCFILENNGKYLLVDTGGGSQVINKIQKVGIDISDIHDIFISHKHIDHLLGIFYVLRMVCYKKSKQEYMGKLNIYCAKEVKEIYNPHQHYHSTVKDVAENMRNLEIKNLILWHTRDNNLANRKELYTQEAKEYFVGNVYVPDDLEEIIL